MAFALELSGVTKDYGRLRAVDGVSFSVREGEIVGLLGHNGAGKTTLMKLVLGVTPCSAGTVRVLGRSPRAAGWDALRRAVGYLPESVSFYGTLTGREVLRYFARLKDVDRDQCNQLLKRVGLAGAADRRVKTYSKGMRQRLGLAQALLGRPRLLLFDEPTVGLDPLAARDFYMMLDDMRAEGVTVILSSHVLAGIEHHIDRAAILRDGQLLVAGTMDELRRRAGLPVTIRVRGPCEDAAWEERLRRKGVTSQRLNGTQLQLTTAFETKLDIMRLLLDLPGVEDIELAPPSLETLYAYYGTNRVKEQSCTPS